MNQTGSTVQSLDRVFDIVETLSNHGNELSISQLCAFTGLNKSTVHRMLASLRARGYVVQTSSGAYRLTFKFCSLSQKIINNVSILPLVLPHLRKLSMSVQEIVHFVIQDNTNTVYLDRLEPPNSNYRSTVNIGMLRPLHTSPAERSFSLPRARRPGAAIGTMLTKRPLHLIPSQALSVSKAKC